MEYRKGIMKISLAENLRSLMIKHLFEKITIKQICDETGVIRATFYNYFDDKYDCLNWIVWHDLVEENLKDIDTLDIRTYLMNIGSVVKENKSFYRSAYNVTGQNSFEDMVRNNLAIFLKAYFENHRRKNYLEEYDNAVLAQYYAEGIAFEIRIYVRSSDTIHDDIIQMGMDLMKNSFFDFIEN